MLRTCNFFNFIEKRKRRGEEKRKEREKTLVRSDANSETIKKHNILVSLPDTSNNHYAIY